MVSVGQDLIVLGGFSDSGGTSNSLYKLSCSSNKCNWETLSQKLKTPRSQFVAIPVPDEFIHKHRLLCGPF